MLENEDMNKTCLIGMAFLSVMGISFTAAQDVVVGEQAEMEPPPRALFLEPVQSLSVPNPGVQSGMIRRVHLYADKKHGAESVGDEILYLVAEMDYWGQKSVQPHIVGIFQGYMIKDVDQMKLADMDGDGMPELLLFHHFFVESPYVRVFRFSTKPNAMDQRNSITSSAMLKQVGCFSTGTGTVTLEGDGVIAVAEFSDGGKVPLSVKKYRLEQGADELEEVE